MKKILFILFFISLSCKDSDLTKVTSENYIQETEKKIKQKDVNLYEFIDLNIDSEKAKNYLNNLGEYKSSNFTENYKDYHYVNSGIQFRTTIDGKIITIFCFNKNVKMTNKPVRFSGKLPFNLSFDDSLESITQKIGEGSLYSSQGFYGRIYKWKVQDSLKVSMEMELPRNDNDKIFIEQISLSKNK